MSIEDFKDLIDRYTAGVLIAEEQAQLSKLLSDPAYVRQLEEIMDVQLTAHLPGDYHYPETVERIQRSLAASLKTSATVHSIPPVHRVHFLRKWGWVAASILLVFSVGAYFWNTNTKQKPTAQQDQIVAAAKDVEPGGNKATLTLSDGKIINLDEANNGELAKDGGARVVKSAEGQIIYNAASSTASVVYNTMSTPRGGQYQLTLPDGSRVWLNAASSITYPTVFTGKERLVKITGEAYFEVTKNAAKPFVVSIDEQTKVKVLGTQFNVNAYKEEGRIKTSLIEGAVQIGNHVLQPGQAWVDGKVNATNTDQDVAWKNGLFNFNKMSLKDAMHQISRWYSIEVIYEKGIPDIQLWGKMGRDLNLGQVLDMLAGMEVHYRMEAGNKLIILP